LRWLVANNKALKLFGLENINFFYKNNNQISELAKPEMKQVIMECNKTDKEALESKKTIIYIQKNVKHLKKK